MPSYKYTYFTFKSRPEVNRLLFLLAGVEYENNCIDHNQYWAMRSDGKLPLLQLPILETDGRIIIQSRAIQRYLAKKFGFYGNGVEDELLIDEAVETAEEILDYALPWIYRELDEKKNAEIKKEYWDYHGPRLLPFLEKRLEGSTSGFFVGDSLTVADLSVFNAIDILSDCAPEELTSYKKLLEHKAKIETNPKLTKYIGERQLVPIRQTFLGIIALKEKEKSK
ncbi:glutathione S-transferase 3 [Strongylocentrotus purpuratus]|uniref:Glutathione transferase n=1 Tax=Strongylocentrotus purpuratus TaxID=7668 RepID=A0A7M7R9I3_STRPU|nr:glutathione S-transferase 3 [Strongylocentrotus purpuratus]|eukprot:XP_781175.1 PREDICTED: glutathione S-transferase 3 [Strongylocentrotus purpuratus]